MIKKRINNDILLNLSDTAQVVSRGKKTADAMNTAVRHKLNDVNVETGLKYYLDNETFKGDYILDNYKDKHVFDVIAKHYAKDPTIKNRSFSWKWYYKSRFRRNFKICWIIF